MEFEEVSKFIRQETAQDVNLSTTSLDLRLHNPRIVDSPYIFPGNSFHQQDRHDSEGLSRRMTSVTKLVRRLKRSKSKLTKPDLLPDRSLVDSPGSPIAWDGFQQDLAYYRLFDESLTSSASGSRPAGIFSRSKRLRKLDRNESDQEITDNTGTRETDGETSPFSPFEETTTLQRLKPPRTYRSLDDMSLNRKRPNSSIVPLYDDDRSIINTVDPDLLIGSLKKEADQFEELLVFQLDKIEQYKKEIIHWIAKLKEMDDAVEILSSNITTIRSEKLMTMKQILNETNKREPFLKKARDQHKKIVRGIEHYSKSNDSGIRLKQLLAKYETAHHREMISARIRYWIFPIVAALSIGVTWLCLPSS